MSEFEKIFLINYGLSLMDEAKILEIVAKNQKEYADKREFYFEALKRCRKALEIFEKAADVTAIEDAKRMIHSYNAWATGYLAFEYQEKAELKFKLLREIKDKGSRIKILREISLLAGHASDKHHKAHQEFIKAELYDLAEQALRMAGQCFKLMLKANEMSGNEKKGYH